MKIKPHAIVQFLVAGVFVVTIAWPIVSLLEEHFDWSNIPELFPPTVKCEEAITKCPSLTEPLTQPDSSYSQPNADSSKTEIITRSYSVRAWIYTLQFIGLIAALGLTLWAIVALVKLE